MHSCAVNESSTNIEVVSGNHLNSFYQAGTTSRLRDVYQSFDEDKKRTLTSNETQLIENVLKQAKVKKHQQKKIAGIYAALEIKDDDQQLCLLLTEEVVFDITKNKEYMISQEQSLQLSEMFKP